MTSSPKHKITLYDIARLTGTSKSTVSRVLMNATDVAEPTRQKILDAMAQHGYTPSRFARGLAGGRSGMVAVVLPGMYSGYYAEVLKGIAVAAHQRGVRLITSIAHGPDEYFGLVAEYAEPGRADGVILVSPAAEVLRRKAPPSPVPFVMVSARPVGRDDSWGRMDTVTVDNEGGMAEVLDHLREQGCRRLVHLAGPAGNYDAVARRRAFDSYCSRHGLAGQVQSAGDTNADAIREVRELMRHKSVPVDGIVAFNDDFAIAVVRHLREQGVRLPGALAVTGCDDEHAAGLIDLTTLHMPMVELGEEAARLLLDRLDGRRAGLSTRHVMLNMTLVVRASSFFKCHIN